MTEADGQQSPLDEFVSEPVASTRRWLPWLITLAVVSLVCAAYVGAQAYLAGRIPTGTTSMGVDIGGMSPAQAQAALQTVVDERRATPLVVTSEAGSYDLDPATAGLDIDVEQTIHGLTGFTLAPSRILQAISGSRDIAAVSAIDHVVLTAAVAEFAPELEAAPVDGAVTIASGIAVATDPVTGVTVDVTATSGAIEDAFLAGEQSVDAVTVTAEPAIDQAATDAAVASATKALASPVWLTSADKKVELPSAAIATVISYQPSGPSLELSIDADALLAEIRSRATDLETAPTDASFQFDNGAPVIVGGADGTTLDPDKTVAALQQAIASTDRTAELAFTTQEPAVTTASLEALGINEVVASFSTTLPYEPIRTENLRVAAEKITGVVVAPGETFSVTEAVSPITAEGGYQAAGVIVGGYHSTGMGGGLSQMATTTYNAGFFAGMTILDFRPHSEWFARYPEGRESTMAVGSIDMVWRNDSPYGVMLRSWIADSKLTVEVWSTPYYNVETTTSGRSNVVAPTTVYSTAANCAASNAGNPGFTVTVSRKVSVIATGEVTIDESNTWTYRAQNKTVCGAAPDPAAEADPADASDGTD